MSASTTDREFFEQMYKASGDPWAFASSEYETDRYEATIRALKHRRYERAFEPGCSIGVLSAKLATLCWHVDAMDISPTAVEEARRRCRDLANVETTCGTLPDSIPDGEFDLIVFSEIGYYFEEDVLRRLGETLVSRLRTGGVLLGVHWLGRSKDHLLKGDRVHEILGSIDGIALEVSERHESGDGGFRLERWVRRA